MPQRYTTVAIWLHWLVAILILSNIALIWSEGLWPDGLVRPVINTHKSIGLTVLGLAVVRLLWRWTHRPPPDLPGLSKPEKTAAHSVHYLWYVVIFLMPLSGYVFDSTYKDAATHSLLLFGLIPFPRIAAIVAMDPAHKEAVHDQWFAVHSIVAKVIYGLFVLHVAGALKHQWWDRKPELQRMGVGR